MSTTSLVIDLLTTAHGEFYSQFLFSMSFLCIIAAMVWIIVGGLAIGGPTDGSGNLHFVSDGFSNYPVTSTLILGIASHFVFVLRVLGAYNLLKDDLYRNIILTFMPFIAGCGLIVLRFDVVDGPEHVMAAGLSIIFSIVFYEFLMESLHVEKTARFAAMLLVLFFVTWVIYVSFDQAQENEKKTMRMVCGIIEYILIECIFFLDLNLLLVLSKSSRGKILPSPEPDEEALRKPIEIQNQTLFHLQDKRSLSTINWRVK